MRTWNLPVALDPDSGLPLYLQICRSIAGDIRLGRLRPGDALPGSRTLARALGVHRNTVLAGYTELAAEGWITTELAGGTFVARDLPTRSLARGAPPTGVALEQVYPLAPPIPYDRPLAYGHGMLILAKGTPDVRLLPVAELSRAYRRVVLRHGAQLLAYGDPRGHIRFRAELVSMLSTARGVAANVDSVMVTRGSQMAVDLVARALVDPGDVIAVEAIGHPGAWSAFRLAGAELVPVPVDSDGLSVDALATLLAARRVRAIYVTPHHQFPTTTVMPPGRRRQLLDLARAHRVAIIEDDYDHEFHYDGRPILPLASGGASLATVIYIGTLSKILAPGLRVGFVVAPPPVIGRLSSLRAVTDIQGDLTQECALAELFRSGELGRHVRRMRRIYQARRDTLVEELRRQLGSVISCDVPSGGMALWVRVAPDIDVDAWALRAHLSGVVFRSGRMYDFTNRDQACMRLGFTFHDEAELAEAVRRMAAALPVARPDHRERDLAPRATADRAVLEVQSSS